MNFLIKAYNIDGVSNYPDNESIARELGLTVENAVAYRRKSELALVKKINKIKKKKL